MNCDAVIVGAGVMGASIAYELAKRNLRVVVVDKSGGVGHGSTSASSAVVRFNFSTWAGVATSWESKFHWENWGAHLGTIDGDLARYEKSGVVFLDVGFAPRRLYLPLFDSVGVRYEEWDPERLAAEVPGIDTGRYWPPKRLDDERFWAEASGTLGAVHTPDGGYVGDPQLAAANLAAAAVRHGAEFLLNSAVTEVVCRNGRAGGVVLSDGTRIEAPVIVNAAGPWSSRVNALAGVGDDFAVSLRPLRQEVHHVRTAPSEPAATAGHVTIADADLGTYVRGDAGGFLVGGTEPECEPLQWVDDPDAASLDVTASVFDSQVTRAARRLSRLTVPNRPRGVVGVYDVASDWTPIYDRTSLPGFYVAIGTSGNQFKNAPVVGRLMAEIIDHCENGGDHDAHPVKFEAPYTGNVIDLAAYSRLRTSGEQTSGTVLG